MNYNLIQFRVKNYQAILGLLTCILVLILSACIGFDPLLSNDDSKIARTLQFSDPTVEITREYEFAKNRIFDLAYIDDVLGYRDQYVPGDKITKLNIYYEVKDHEIEDIGSKLMSILYVDPNDTSAFKSEVLKRYVQQLDTSLYEWGEVHYKTGIPYVVFDSSLEQSRAIAFYMEFKKAISGEIVKVGDISQQRDGDSLYLKLLYPSSIKSRHSNMTWQLMWRNIYELPRGIAFEFMEIKLFKGLSGSELTQTENLEVQQDGKTNPLYIQILGLDQYNSRNNLNPDGKIDNRSQIYRPDWSLIIFPEREPFNSDATFIGFGQLHDKVPEPYDSKLFGLQLKSISKYYFQITTY